MFVKIATLHDMRVLEHNSFLRKKRMFFALLFVLRPMVAMGVDHVLNVGGTTIALSETCDSEHKLNVLYNGTTYCAPAKWAMALTHKITGANRPRVCWYVFLTIII